MHLPLFRSSSTARRPWVGLLAGLLAVALVLTGCDSNGGGGDDDDDMTNATITQLASNQDNLSTLVSALQSAELDDDLNSEESTFTVFAPVNSAFENIDADELTSNSELLSEVLTYHVVPGQAIASGDIQDGQTVETLEGDTLRFSKDGNSVQVNGTSVTTADLQASNGVVHLVDGVLLETVDAVDRATLTPQLSTLADAIAGAGLAGSNSPLRNETLTLFAPADGSFDGLDLGALTSNTELLGRILQYHAVPGSRITSDQIAGGETPITLEGGTLDIAVNNDTVTVNGIPVTTTDIETENATIHLIDGVLLQRIDIVDRASITEGLGTLASAVQAAGLDASDSPLRNDDPVTVFAPVDGAFESLDVGELTGNSEILNRVLPYHVVSGAVTSDQLSSGDVQTLEGGSITVQVGDDGVTVNGIPVTTPNIQTRNGVVHLIDGVLLRRTNAVQRALVTSRFSILADLVSQAGLADDLSNEDAALTVFAPTNEALLTALDTNDNGEIDDGEVPGNAQSLLQYHVGDGVFYAADAPTAPTGTMIPDGDTDVATLEGSNVLVRRDGSSVTLNPEGDAASSVIAPDVDVTNGVIHGIDTVLNIPSSN